MARICEVTPHKNYLSTICCIILIQLSCGEARYSLSDATIHQIAQLQCEAINLKNQRFDLFEALRAEEEKVSLDTIKIASLKSKADSIRTQSLDLAHILKSKLDSIFLHLKENPTKKQIFNKKLEEKVLKSGCLNE